MFNTKVTTNYSYGTTINLDANDAVNFLVGIAITVISKINDRVENTSDKKTTNIIKKYNSGNPEAIKDCILQTNVDILFKFVMDVVLNDTIRGIYLFFRRSNDNLAPYHLIIKALDDAHNYYMKHGNDNYKRNPERYFNRYNDEFINLVNR